MKQQFYLFIAVVFLGLSSCNTAPEKGGNSGIFYLARELEGKKIWYTAPEYQILDNFGTHMDNTLGKDGNRRAGSLYDLPPPILRMPKVRWSGTLQKSFPIMEPSPIR